jgi:hypothetical protein
MHPKRAELLAEIHEDSRDNDTDLREELAIFIRPDRHGLATSLDAGVGVAMCVSSALMLDFLELAISWIDDDTWDSMTGGESSPGSPPNEEVKPTAPPSSWLSDS